MPTLREWFEQCKEDTKKYVGRQAANSLSLHSGFSDNDLIEYIKKTIRIKSNQANGFFIHKNNGVSLEAIVALHCSSLFAESDIKIARTTIGL